MKKFLISLTIFAIVVTSVLSSYSRAEKKDMFLVGADNSDTASKIKSLESDLSAIAQEKSQITKDLNKAKNGKTTQLGLKQYYDRELVAVEKELATTEELISQYETSIADTQIEIEELKVEQENQEKLFDEMVRMSFEYGNDDYLEIIFGSESFSDLLSRLDLITYHLAFNQNVLDDMKEIEENLTTKQLALESSKTSLEEYKASKLELQDDYTSKSNAASSMISKLQKDEAELAKALKEIEESQKQLEKDIAELAKQLNDGSKYTGGQFIWPLPSQYMSRSSGYDWRTNPISGKKEFHNGLDIPAPRGTKIYAAAAGTVVKSAWYGGYGNCVIINHGGGLMTLYGHCNSLNVKVGQTVKQGDTIAFVGTTGYSTGYHLHFTVYVNGDQHDNPWKYLPKAS